MIKFIVPISLFIFSFNYTSYAQKSSIWRGYISYSNSQKPDETPCDFIKNGQMLMPSILSSQAYYKANFIYLDTICSSQNFSYEVRLKTNSIIENNDNNAQISFYSNGKKTGVSLANNKNINTSITIADSIIIQNNDALVLNLSEWRTVRLNFKNDTFNLLIDGIKKYETVHRKTICNLDILSFSLPQDASIDWIKVYDNQNNITWQEDFLSCNTLSYGVVCDPLRLDKSISISKPCANDTLSLTANFPAMTYRWTNPNAQISTTKIGKFINPINGIYDLTANVNKCFTFSKSFPLNISPQTTITKNIQLCLGKEYTLPNGRKVNKAGTYRDTFTTRLGCDSIIITQLSYNDIPVNPINASVCGNKKYILPSGKEVSASGFYRDTSINTEGCLQITEVNLSVTNSLERSINKSICEGESYILPKGRIVQTAGIYRDTLKVVDGCDSIIIVNLEVNEKPKVQIEYSKDIEVQEGDMLKLMAIVTNIKGEYQLSWFENDVLINSNDKQINISVKGIETLYKVNLKTASGCINQDSTLISALPKIEIPNAFSPNNDNLNDTFSFVNKSNNERYYTIDTFFVFDRLGRKVYNNENGYKGWDGKLNGEDLESDSYVYLIKLKSPSGKLLQYSGEVILIR